MIDLIASIGAHVDRADTTPVALLGLIRRGKHRKFIPTFSSSKARKATRDPWNGSSDAAEELDERPTNQSEYEFNRKMSSLSEQV